MENATIVNGVEGGKHVVNGPLTTDVTKEIGRASCRERV